MGVQRYITAVTVVTLTIPEDDYYNWTEHLPRYSRAGTTMSYRWRLQEDLERNQDRHSYWFQEVRPNHLLPLRHG
jgi:hypothetical protein